MLPARALGVVRRVAVGPLVDRRVAGRSRTGCCRRRWTGRGCPRRRSRCRRRRGSTCRGRPATSRTVTCAAGVEREVGVEREPGQPVDALPRRPVAAVPVAGASPAGRATAAARSRGRCAGSWRSPGRRRRPADPPRRGCRPGSCRSRVVVPAASVRRSVPLRAVCSTDRSGRTARVIGSPDLGDALGERHLLEVARGDGVRLRGRGRRHAGHRGDRGGQAAEQEEERGARGTGAAHRTDAPSWAPSWARRRGRRHPEAPVFRHGHLPGSLPDVMPGRARAVAPVPLDEE